MTELSQLPPPLALAGAPSTTLPLVGKDPFVTLSSTEGFEGSLVHQIMPLAGLALWEAYNNSLELINLEIGLASHSVFSLDPAQCLPGVSWADSVYPSDREKLQAFLDAPESTSNAHAVDYRLIVGDGELLWVRHWLLSRTPARDGRSRLRGLLMAIPERKHLEWECLRVSERECNRIGQELHDDLCQVLAGVTFMMKVIGQRAAKSAIDLVPHLDELNDELVGATNRVRSMAHGLFPTQLNYSTLRQALKDFARQTKTRFPVKLSLDLPPNLATHTPEQIIHVYRIAQESVSNSVRHGRATEIRVVLTQDDQHAHMTVEDNGKGFPVSVARPEGIGMHVMQYRARMLGGELQFRNRTPGGAVVELSYPSSPARPRRSSKKLSLA